MIRNIKQLNAFQEFRTDAGIDAVAIAVATGAPPAGLTPAQTARFTARYLNGDWTIVQTPAPPGGYPGPNAPSRGVQGAAGHPLNRLVYHPPQAVGLPQIALLVSYNDERNNFIARIYNDPRRGYGLGLQSFYTQVILSHLNIKKQHTDAFLRDQGNYNLQKVPIAKVTRPIVVRTPNARWSVDLIYMRPPQVAGNARPNTYIFTVVDSFSGYVWARRLTNPQSQTVSNAFDFIINNPPPFGSGNTEPHLLQSDNGAEFRDGFHANLIARGIRHIYSTSYNPKSNGKVERKNREIRKKLKSLFIRNNNHVWNQNDLNNIIININSQPDQRRKISAESLWEVGNFVTPVGPLPVPPALANNNSKANLDSYNRSYQHNRAVQLTAHALPQFAVGDLVRVNMASISTDYRRAYKTRDGVNKIAVHWSPAISRVVGIHQPNIAAGGTRYRPMYSIVVGLNPVGQAPGPGGAPLMRGNRPWLFSGNELTRAGGVPSTVTPAPGQSWLGAFNDFNARY